MKFTLVAALSVALMACKADSSSSTDGGGGETGPDSGSGVGPDNNVQVVVDGNGDGTLILYGLNPEGDELKEVNRVPVAESGTLFDVETIPEVSVIQAQMFEDDNRWGIPSNVQPGQSIALSPLTQVVYNLAGREGVTSLNPGRVETLNQQVREGVAPGVTNLYAGTGAVENLPEEGNLAATDLELTILYRLGLDAVSANEGGDGPDSVTLPGQRDEEPQLNVLLNDLGSGVVSGFDLNGAELRGMPYNPLTFIDRYQTALQTYADEYGNEAVQNAVEGQAFSRFISRDARCDNARVSEFFSSLPESVALDAQESAGAYSNVPGSTDFNLDTDTEVGISAEQELGGDTIDVAEDKVFTCSLSEESGNGSSLYSGLVRFVSDIDGDEEKDEVTLVADQYNASSGEGDLGIFIASDSGEDYAAFGDVNPRGGWNDDEDPDNGDGNEPIEACGAAGYEPFASTGNVSVDSDTIGLANVGAAGNSVDADSSTSATLNVYLGLLGLGQAELFASTDTTVETSDRVAALVSVPDSIINLNVLESYTLDIYRDGNQVASEVGVSLADVDLGGVFNDTNLKRVELDTQGESFDEIRFRVNAGVLSTDIRTEVFEICHRPAFQ